MKFNTIIKYTRIPDKDDLSMQETENILACNNPYIEYRRESQTLIIQGKDVNLFIKAKNIHIEEVA